MRIKMFTMAALAVGLATEAAAQGPWSRDWSRDDGYSRDGGRYGRGGDPVDGAIRELTSIFRRARVDRHEANHFQRAIAELDRFRAHAARGQFHREHLDRAIDDMRDLAQADQLHPRDRQVIGARIQDLRWVRNRGNEYDRGFFGRR